MPKHIPEVAEGYYKLKDLPKGTFIKRNHTAKKVYVRGGYVRELKIYSITDTEDINKELFAKASVSVYAGFIY